MKIVHLISGLNSGGAEKTLYKLVINDKKNEHIVISLKNGGIFKNKFEQNKIINFSLNFKFNIFLIYEFFKLINLIKSLQPDLIQSWMYYSNFITIFIRLFYKVDIFWNIRASFYKKFYPFISRIIIYFSALNSHFIPKKIIYCSNESIVNHEKIFYSNKKSILIPNGFSVFKKISFNKNLLNLKKFNFDKNNIIFSMIARFDPHKNHNELVKKFETIIKQNNKVILLLVGSNISSKDNFLYQFIQKRKLSKNIILFDHIDNLDNLYSIIDFHILLSFSESFPNVIAETMSRGIPNISSNVGHASNIIDKHGWIIENNDIHNLHLTINEAIKIYKNKDKFQLLRNNCINHIANNYNLKKMILSYNSLWSNNA